MLGLLVVGAACGGARTASGPVPQDPGETVAAFLDAARSDDVQRMAQLWGTESGPALQSMDPEVARQRLFVMAQFLSHESFEVLVDPTLSDERIRQRTIRARLHRSGCEPIVPFTLVRYREGWLVNDIDLAAAGSPTEQCEERPGVSR